MINLEMGPIPTKTPHLLPQIPQKSPPQEYITISHADPNPKSSNIFGGLPNTRTSGSIFSSARKSLGDMGDFDIGVLGKEGSATEREPERGVVRGSFEEDLVYIRDICVANQEKEATDWPPTHQRFPTSLGLYSQTSINSNKLTSYHKFADITGNKWSHIGQYIKAEQQTKISKGLTERQNSPCRSQFQTMYKYKDTGLAKSSSHFIDTQFVKHHKHQYHCQYKCSQKEFGHRKPRIRTLPTHTNYRRGGPIFGKKSNSMPMDGERLMSSPLNENPPVGKYELRNILSQTPLDELEGKQTINGRVNMVDNPLISDIQIGQISDDYVKNFHVRISKRVLKNENLLTKDVDTSNINSLMKKIEKSKLKWLQKSQKEKEKSQTNQRTFSESREVPKWSEMIRKIKRKKEYHLEKLRERNPNVAGQKSIKNDQRNDQLKIEGMIHGLNDLAEIRANTISHNLDNLEGNSSSIREKQVINKFKEYSRENLHKTLYNHIRSNTDIYGRNRQSKGLRSSKYGNLCFEGDFMFHKVAQKFIQMQPDHDKLKDLLLLRQQTIPRDPQVIAAKTTMENNRSQFYNNMKEEISIIIEVCRNCNLHSWNTRHIEEKYESYYTKMRDSILDLGDISDQNIKIYKNQIPLKYADRPLYATSCSKSSLNTTTDNILELQPKLGAFEISHDGKLIFSKLFLKVWPHMGLVTQRVSNYLTALKSIGSGDAYVLTMINTRSASPYRFGKAPYGYNRQTNFRTPSYNPRSISPGLYITEGGTEKHNSTITYVPNDDNHKRSKSNPKGTSHHRSPGKPTNLSFTVGNNERTKEQERVRYITSPGSGNIMLLERDMIQVGGGKAKNLDETIIKANKDNEKISDREIQKSTNKDTSEPEQIGNKSTVHEEHKEQDATMSPKEDINHTTQRNTENIAPESVVQNKVTEDNKSRPSEDEEKIREIDGDGGTKREEKEEHKLERNIIDNKQENTDEINNIENKDEINNIENKDEINNIDKKEEINNIEENKELTKEKGIVVPTEAEMEARESESESEREKTLHSALSHRSNRSNPPRIEIQEVPHELTTVWAKPTPLSGKSTPKKPPTTQNKLPAPIANKRETGVEDKNIYIRKDVVNKDNGNSQENGSPREGGGSKNGEQSKGEYIRETCFGIEGGGSAQSPNT